ncbi:hypothetical protein [Streptomyces sp. NPDC048111]|uniref:hypothetical protein n=1 Tax=Streptomyces sp. NPDC048111 TaxID=3365500 RepID=UPI003723FD67
MSAPPKMYCVWRSTPEPTVSPKRTVWPGKTTWMLQMPTSSYQTSIRETLDESAFGG